MLKHIQYIRFFKSSLWTQKPWILLVCAGFILSSCGKIDQLAASKTQEIEPNQSVEIKSSASDIQITKEPRASNKRDKKARDFNPKNMFGEEIEADAQRLDRLERMLQTLRNDFDTVSPSLKRLMVLEGDLQTLISELQDITIFQQSHTDRIEALENKFGQQQEVYDNIPALLSADQPIAESQEQLAQKVANTDQKATMPQKAYDKKQAPSKSEGVIVYDVRVGEHKHKTRIVLDVNAKTPFNVSLDNSEKILLIELPDVLWQAKSTQSFAKSLFLKNFAVNRIQQSGNKGFLIAFELKRDASIAYNKMFPAISSPGAQRIVIDLVGAESAYSEDK